MYEPCMTSANGSASDSRVLDDCLARLIHNDPEAFATLYERTRVSVYAFAFSILKNAHDAEDVLHDCYIRLHSAASEYRSHGKPMAWILTIVRNLCLMRLREQQRTTAVSPEDWDSCLPEGRELDADDRLMMTACLQELSDEERQIVVLHAIVGFKHREIAHMTGLSLSTELAKYSRSLKKLKRRMERGE